MADYGKIEITATLSTSSDYSKPYAKREFTAYEVTTPTDGGVEKVTCDTAGTTFSVAKYAAMTGFVFKNLDTTNYVTVTFYTVGKGATSCVSRVPAKGTLVIPDPDPTQNSGLWTFAANGAACKAEAFVMGT